MMRICVLSFTLVIVATMLRAEDSSPAKWRKDIDRFLEKDATVTPPANSILFVGSSSIRKWDLQASFPDLPVINRGFGGSQIADSNYYFDQLITKHRPQVVVLYAGDNDIQKGKTPCQVYCDYCEFRRKLGCKLPATRLIFIAIKPSVKRWQIYPKMAEANRMIACQALRDPMVTYLDVATPMIVSGEPDGRLFAKDDLHLSPAGYELWDRLLRPHLRLKGSSLTVE